MTVTFVFAVIAQNSNTSPGCISGNCKNGYGKYVTNNGAYYEGNFKKGRFDGKGTLTLVSGQKYTGDFKEGNIRGTGKTVYTNGDIYEGQYLSNNPNGLGKITYYNGSQYTGNMNDGYRQGEGIYTLRSGYSMKGIFKNDKPDVVEYFDAENKKITKEIFDTQEKKEIVNATETYKQQHEVKLQQFMLKNKGVIVQNINIPFKDVTDLSDISYRTDEVDIVFSNTTAGLFCIKRKENRPSSYDIYQDQITAFSVNNCKRVLSGFVQHLQQNDLGRDVIEEFNKKEAKSNTFKFNDADIAVKQILDDLNYLTTPAGNIMFEAANEEYMIFKDPHRENRIDYGNSTYYFINRKSNLCEKIVNVNSPSDMVWNEDFTKSCLKQIHKLPEHLVPDVYKESSYYSIFYIIDWKTKDVKHLDDHVMQLNYLREAINDKIIADAKWEASRPERERQSRKEWDEYYESQRKINENVEKSKALTPKTAKERYFYYNSVGNKVFTD